MRFSINAVNDKAYIFKEVLKNLSSSIHVSYEDRSRPWGGFIVIDENDSDHFIREYFPNLLRKDLDISGKLSPKILIVAPRQRLSWQYHLRRAEIWKVIAGEASVVTSETDEEDKIREMQIGDIIELKQGERHRLVGGSNWGIIAEIWRHTDKDNPSNEEDIIRIQDDFGR